MGIPGGDVERNNQEEQHFSITGGHRNYIITAMDSLLSHQGLEFVQTWQSKITEWKEQAQKENVSLSFSFLQSLYYQHGSEFDTAQGEIFQAMTNEIGNDSATILGSIEILGIVKPPSDRVISNIQKTAENILLKGAIMHQLTPLFDGLDTDTEDTPTTSFASFYRDWQDEGKLRIRNVLQSGVLELSKTHANDSISQIVGTIIADAL